MTSYIVRAPAFPAPDKRFGGWTDERVEELRKLWMEGLSCTQIASRLGGVTRNAVVGKAHRVGLPGRLEPNNAGTAKRRHRRIQDYAQPQRFKVKRPAAIIVEIASKKPVHALIHRAQTALDPLRQSDGKLISILSLQRGLCAWMDADPRQPDAAFCGRPVKPGGGSWCQHHHELVYQPERLERKRAR